jgi:hypothetical protein
VGCFGRVHLAVEAVLPGFVDQGETHQLGIEGIGPLAVEEQLRHTSAIIASGP